MKYVNGEEMKSGDIAVFGRSHFSAVGVIKEVFDSRVVFFCVEEGTTSDFTTVEVHYNGFEKLA